MFVLLSHPFPDDRFHLLREAIVMVSLAGNDCQPTIMELPRRLYRIFQRYHVICVPMKKQHWPLETVDGVLHMDGLGYSYIISAQGQPFHHAHFLWNVQRIKTKPQQAALPSTAGYHKGRSAQDQSFDQIRIHAAHQCRQQAALGMAGQVNICDEIQ